MAPGGQLPRARFQAASGISQSGPPSGKRPSAPCSFTCPQAANAAPTAAADTTAGSAPSNWRRDSFTLGFWCGPESDSGRPGPSRFEMHDSSAGPGPFGLGGRPARGDRRDQRSAPSLTISP